MPKVQIAVLRGFETSPCGEDLVADGSQVSESSTPFLIGNGGRNRGRRNQGDFDSAPGAFQQQLKLAENINDRSLAADAHESIGSVFLRQERLPEALDHFRENYRVNKAMGNKLSLTYSAMGLGDVLWRLGRYQEATKLYYEASVLAGESGELQAEVNSSRAEMLLSQRFFSQDIAKCRLAVAGAEPRTLSNIKRVLGLAQVFSGEGRQGLQNCQASAALASKLHDPWLTSQVRLVVADAMLETGDARGALAIAAEEQTNLKRWGQIESQWHAFVISVRASRKLGDQKSAQQFTAEAKELFSELKLKWGAATYKEYAARPDIRKALAELAESTASEY